MQRRFTVKNSFFFFFLFFLIDYALLAKSPISSWKVDMYNQESLKSQEAGNLIDFPVGAVTKGGIVIESDGFTNQKTEEIEWNDYDPNGLRFNPSLSPANPIKPDNASIDKGKKLYEVNCAVCHGDDGQGGTRVAQLRGVPPINTLVSNLF